MSAGRCDAVVIGSGISGLGAALSLANRGRSVRVLEALAEPGGLIKPHRAAGYEFDVGVQYLGQAGPGQTLPRYLEELGVHVDFREIDPECLERYDFPGFQARLVKGPAAQEELLIERFPAEEKGIRWFFRTLHAFDVLQAAATGEGRAPWRLGAALRGLPGLRGAARLSFAAWLAPRVRDPHLLAALSCFVGDIALPPSRASALACLIDWTHFMRGAWYPVGGGGAIRDAFVAALAERGAGVRASAVVERIAPDPGGFAVTLAGGEVVRARAVVSSADACSTFGWLSGRRPAASAARKARRFAPSLSAFGAFLGVDADLGAMGLTAANRWVYESDDLEAIYRPLLRGEDSGPRGVFLTSPTRKDPGRPRAPQGREALTVLAFAPAFSPGGDAPPPTPQADVRQRVDRILETVERALPGISSKIVFRQDISPTTLWQHGRARMGGLYGPEMSPEQGLPRRFLPTTGVPGLYLAGASVFGCGVLPCLLSGRVSAAFARRHLR